MRGDTWTVEREEELVRLALEGKSPQEVARLLDRSVTAVIMRLSSIAEDRSVWHNAIKQLKSTGG